MKTLVAVDGSEHSLATVRRLIDHARWYRAALEVELVHVQQPIPYEGRAGAAIGKEQVRRYYEEEGEAALAESRKLLDAAGIPYTVHSLVGPIAETIVDLATQLDCDQIAVGTHGRTAAGNVMLGSVAARVLHLAPMPVLFLR